ncbi:hypothetical protein [Corynebacterium mayonis]|uniref:hypothetical protein n=1 Tax=Corynebacterium mayonis TaxID=3062461 RepID=UPI0031405774
MSFDVMIIDPATVPTGSHGEFMEWYRAATSWSEDRDYGAPVGSAASIVACYEELKVEFPSIDDLDWDEDEDEQEEANTEYVLGDDFVYIAFDWSEAEEAASACVRVAHKHGLAFVDISGTTSILFPDGRVVGP